MSFAMTKPGPITPAGLSWAEQEARRVERSPLGWEGFRVGPESGLTPLEVEALRRTDQLEVTQ